MKATGIVRRIDDLGRVVIPKEIRRTMRIREGDPLEIYTDRDGEVIFKKYSPIGSLTDFATQYAETLAKISGNPTCITDKDTIIAVGGAPKRDLYEKRLSSEIENIMEEKTTFVTESDIPITDGGKYNAGVIVPIIAEGDSIGNVIILKNEGEKTVSEVDTKLAQSAALFFGKQMEI